jgi:hypothetical protein
MRTITASERGLGNQLRCRIVSALAQVLIDDTLGSVFAASAATSNGQFVLYVEERASTAIDSLADVFIGHGMAYADVHQGPSFGGADSDFLRARLW